MQLELEITKIHEPDGEQPYARAVVESFGVQGEVRIPLTKNADETFSSFWKVDVKAGDRYLFVQDGE